MSNILFLRDIVVYITYYWARLFIVFFSSKSKLLVTSFYLYSGMQGIARRRTRGAMPTQSLI